jgi:hypothetical protein
VQTWKGGLTAAKEAAAMDGSVPETLPVDIPLWQLRDNLIDLTVALADELAADGDADRLAALSALYRATHAALQDRELRGVR